MTMINAILSEPLQEITYRNAGQLEETRYEQMHVEVFSNAEMGSISVAREISNTIKTKQRIGEMCVLGLATGSSPIGIYKELVQMHKEEGLSFLNVITFNLDEYYPMQKASTHSYHYFMHEYLFDHIDIKPENIHIPSGVVPMEQVNDYCLSYEKEIEKAGGLDFQLLGIGRTGHIGFNEPGSHQKSFTRMVTLDYLTKSDAAGDFHGIDNVPVRAITMGVRTIMQAKRIVLIAWGIKKAEIVKAAIEGEITAEVTASYLQSHDNTTFILDEDAGSKLTRFQTPWLVGKINWDHAMRDKAIVWLSNKVNKPILKLTNRDYNNNGMSDLIVLEGSAYDVNIKMHNRLQHSITGWPGGKPNSDDRKRPERTEPAKKRIIIFSPHPDDDVISMGGTFLRLVEQGHDVHVVYQTSGSNAVSDHDALKFIAFTKHLSETKLPRIEELISEINEKQSGAMDSPEIRKIKGLIRRLEAVGGARYCGLADSHIHFLDLPFYETGRVKKNALGEKDYRLTREIIEKIKPHQIYAAGDLSDPNGTHKVCLKAITTTLECIKDKPFMKDCWVWLYRGAWHEWPVNEIEMAVPLSPDEVMKKRKAIFFHETQKDGVMYQGNDTREFWQRVQDRNAETASAYNKLGLTEYEAIEAFRRYHF